MVIIVPPSYTILSNVPSAPEPELFQQIERAGRTCYKSEDKITDESAYPFVTMILGKGHNSVIEHSNIICQISSALYESILHRLHMGEDGMLCFLRFTNDKNGVLVSGSIRAFRSFHQYFGEPYPELRGLGIFLSHNYSTAFANIAHLDEEYTDDIQLITDTSNFSKIEQLRHLCVSVRLVCDRGVSHEIVRNKQEIVFSQESSRYCDYMKDKFGNAVSVICPEDYVEGTPEYAEWLSGMEDGERHYMALRKMGSLAQIARGQLPTGLKTEIVVTATLWEWREIFKQRTAEVAHPQMRELMIPLHTEMAELYPDIFA